MTADEIKNEIKALSDFQKFVINNRSKKGYEIDRDIREQWNAFLSKYPTLNYLGDLRDFYGSDKNNATGYLLMAISQKIDSLKILLSITELENKISK